MKSAQNDCSSQAIGEDLRGILLLLLADGRKRVCDEIQTTARHWRSST